MTHARINTLKNTLLGCMALLLCMIVMLVFSLPVTAAPIDVTGDFTIDSGGEYQLIAGATSPLTGTTAAHLLADALIINTTEPVTIIGDPAGHENLRIVCAVEGVNLSIQDLVNTVTLDDTNDGYAYSSIIFTGANNVLTLIGESNLSGANSGEYSSRPVIAVYIGTDLTITGDGQLTVTTKNHAAGIGGRYRVTTTDTTHRSGNITILDTTV